MTTTNLCRAAAVMLLAVWACNGEATPHDRRADPSQSASYSLDVSGVRQFWTIVDLLVKDTEPLPAAWDSLF
ncbi:MAG TPA: hypothetical protein VK845_16495, partial [Gemmatimonadales bacterium]|nr:hypothetical protein [Gemmatimonadales bacterium]